MNMTNVGGTRSFNETNGINHMEGFFCGGCHSHWNRYLRETNEWNKSDIPFWNERLIDPFSTTYTNKKVISQSAAFVLKIQKILKDETGMEFNPDLFNFCKWDKGYPQFPGYAAETGSYRQISVVYHINEDFDGGEDYYPNQNFEYKPKSNSVLIFPSDDEFLHGVKDVTNNIMYTAISFWTTDPAYKRDWEAVGIAAEQ